MTITKKRFAFRWKEQPSQHGAPLPDSRKMEVQRPVARLESAMSQRLAKAVPELLQARGLR